MGETDYSAFWPLPWESSNLKPRMLRAFRMAIGSTGNGVHAEEMAPALMRAMTMCLPKA